MRVVTSPVPRSVVGGTPTGPSRAMQVGSGATVPRMHRMAAAAADVLVQGEVPAKDRAILLYNGECSVCRRLSTWVRNRDEPAQGGHQALDERPIGFDQKALTAINPQLDIWKAYETIHLVLPNGTVLTGGDTIREVLRRLPRTEWIASLCDAQVMGARPFQALLTLGFTILDKARPALGCESCGGEVPWWAKPIAWLARATGLVQTPAH